MQIVNQHTVGAFVTKTGIYYQIFRETDNSLFYVEDDLGNIICNDDIDDIKQRVEETGWIDLLGNFRLTNQGCVYAQKHWF